MYPNQGVNQSYPMPAGGASAAGVMRPAMTPQGAPAQGHYMPNTHVAHAYSGPMAAPPPKVRSMCLKAHSTPIW